MGHNVDASEECLSCHGDCCRRYRVPLTDNDIRRLLQAGKSLSDLIDWVPVGTMYCTYADVRLTGGYFYMVLRRREDGSCSLSVEDDGRLRCGVHGAHPLLCRLYPFSLEGALISHRKCRKDLKKWPNMAELIMQRDSECGGYGLKVKAWNGGRRADWSRDGFIRHLLER